jgi:hypothetical protein
MSGRYHGRSVGLLRGGSLARTRHGAPVCEPLAHRDPIAPTRRETARIGRFQAPIPACVVPPQGGEDSSTAVLDGPGVTAGTRCYTARERLIVRELVARVVESDQGREPIDESWFRERHAQLPIDSLEAAPQGVPLGRSHGVQAGNLRDHDGVALRGRLVAGLEQR